MNKILIFTSPSCKGCDVLKRELKRNNIKADYLDIEDKDSEVRMENLKLANKYGVNSLPTTILLNDGKPKKKWVGVSNKMVGEIKGYG